eukprot:scaffold3685_cov21-Tisochrysis_lutea.AAC.4
MRARPALGSKQSGSLVSLTAPCTPHFKATGTAKGTACLVRSTASSVHVRKALNAASFSNGSFFDLVPFVIEGPLQAGEPPACPPAQCVCHHLRAGPRSRYPSVLLRPGPMVGATRRQHIGLCADPYS